MEKSNHGFDPASNPELVYRLETQYEDYKIRCEESGAKPLEFRDFIEQRLQERKSKKQVSLNNDKDIEQTELDKAFSRTTIKSRENRYIRQNDDFEYYYSLSKTIEDEYVDCVRKFGFKIEQETKIKVHKQRRIKSRVLLKNSLSEIIYYRLWLKNKYYQEKYIDSAKAYIIVSKLYESNERLIMKYFSVDRDAQFPIIVSKDVSLFISYVNYKVKGEEQISRQIFKSYIKDVCLPICQYFSNPKKAYLIFAHSMLDVCDNVTLGPTDFVCLFEQTNSIRETKVVINRYNQRDMQFAFKNCLPQLDNLEEVKGGIIESNPKCIVDLAYELNSMIKKNQSDRECNFSVRSIIDDLSIKNTLDFILEESDESKLAEIVKTIENNDFGNLVNISKEYFCKGLDDKTEHLSDMESKLIIVKRDAELFGNTFLKTKSHQHLKQNFINYFYGMFETGLEVHGRDEYFEEYKDIIYCNHLKTSLKNEGFELAFETEMNDDSVLEDLKDNSIIFGKLCKAIVDNIKGCKDTESVKELGTIVFSVQSLESLKDIFDEKKALFYENYTLTMAWLDQILYNLVENFSLLRSDITNKI